MSHAAPYAEPTDVQAELIETIRRFVEREVVPVASRHDHDDTQGDQQPRTSIHCRTSLRGGSISLTSQACPHEHTGPPHKRVRPNWSFVAAAWDAAAPRKVPILVAYVG